MQNIKKRKKDRKTQKFIVVQNFLFLAFYIQFFKQPA